MKFLSDLRETCKEIFTDVRDGFIESRIIRAVGCFHLAGFSLWITAFILATIFGFAFASVPFTLFIIGAGSVFVGFVLMFVSLGIDEVEFNKLTKRHNARYASR